MLLRYALDVTPLWNTSKEFTEALNLLSPETQALVTKFHFPTDRKLALGSQLLQRLVISDIYSSGEPNTSIPALSAIPIYRDPESGRPSYHPPTSSPPPEDQKWILKDYNVSHHNSHDPALPCLVILAARTCPPSSTAMLRIGVDIVPTAHTRSDSAESFLDSFTSAAVFTPHELDMIHSPVGIEDKVKMLYLHWALKEAYVKAVGTGLVTDLLAIEFRDVGLEEVEGGDEGVDKGVRIWIDGREEVGWRLEVGKLARGHYFALAIDCCDGENGGPGGNDDEGAWRWIEFKRDIWDVWSKVPAAGG